LNLTLLFTARLGLTGNGNVHEDIPTDLSHVLRKSVEAESTHYPVEEHADGLQAHVRSPEEIQEGRLVRIHILDVLALVL
jgi:hypothetical protein